MTNLSPYRPRLPSLRLPVSLLLATGAFIWWPAALVITGDPLFIKHNWPSDWPMDGDDYQPPGCTPINQIARNRGIVPAACVHLRIVALLKSRRLYTLTSSFLLLFILHTILRAYGLLGSAGYPRSW